MASSSGREKMRSRGQRVFAFGSSTPRDLSHLKQIAPTAQNNEGKSGDKPDSPTLHDYIVKARSLSREGGSRSHLVFGSSTPRLLAHLDKIPVNQRAYDAKIPKKSATHNDFKAAPIRYNSVAPLPKPPRKEETRHVITSKDDDIASEPDIVQDRSEFLNELKKHKKQMEDEKKSAEKARNESMASPKIVPKKPITKTNEEVKFAHAPEIVGNVQRTVRINSETHEEAPIAVENLSANKMNDQIEVSQLNDEIAAVEATTEEKDKVVDNLLAKVQQVVNDSADDVAQKAEEVKEELQSEAEEKSEKIKNQVSEGVEDIKDVAKSVADSVKNLAEDTEKKIDNGVKSVESKLENIATETKTVFGSVVSSGEKAIGDVVKNLNDVAKDVNKDVTDSLIDGKETIESGITTIGEKAENVFGDIKKGLENF